MIGIHTWLRMVPGIFSGWLSRCGCFAVRIHMIYIWTDAENETCDSESDNINQCTTTRLEVSHMYKRFFDKNGGRKTTYYDPTANWPGFRIYLIIMIKFKFSWFFLNRRHKGVIGKIGIRKILALKQFKIDKRRSLGELDYETWFFTILKYDRHTAFR